MISGVRFLTGAPMHDLATLKAELAATAAELALQQASGDKPEWPVQARCSSLSSSQPPPSNRPAWPM